MIKYIKTPKTKTTQFGLESIRWMGPVIWIFVQENMKNIKSLKKSKKEITFDKCPCEICKEYVQGTGYLN